MRRPAWPNQRIGDITGNQELSFFKAVHHFYCVYSCQPG